MFKIGDYVDIKVNSAMHAGMPFKWYHGKTGIIWNVTKRALGVEVNKQVRSHIVCAGLGPAVPVLSDRSPSSGGRQKPSICVYRHIYTLLARSMAAWGTDRCKNSQ